MSKPTEVVLTHYSQPHVLQHRMNEANLKHGDTVIANISPVRIESCFGKAVMYFCPIQNIEVVNKIEEGDGLPLPDQATLKNIEIPSSLKPGLYNIRNATLFSNGTLQIIANENTEFEEYNTSGYVPDPFDRLRYEAFGRNPQIEAEMFERMRKIRFMHEVERNNNLPISFSESELIQPTKKKTIRKFFDLFR